MEPAAYREMAETEDRHWWFRGRRAIADRFIGQIAGGRKLKILEIGAGTGGNLRMLEKYGDLTAVEMVDAARRLAMEKTGKEIVSGFLPAGIPDIGRDFDLICMFDVLEHVEDDRAALRKIYELLKPGGYFVMTVPAYQWMWSRHDEYLHHFRRYTRPVLAKKLGQAGFSMQRASYTNMLLFPAALIVRFMDKLTKKGGADASTGSKLPPAPANGVLAALYSFEARLLRIGDLPFGLGLIATCRK
jgi:SAM-dependent methyltransferase